MKITTEEEEKWVETDVTNVSYIVPDKGYAAIRGTKYPAYPMPVRTLLGMLNITVLFVVG